MITRENYFDSVTSQTLEGLPEALKESHRFLVEKTLSGASWQEYETDPSTKEVIDLHLQKLNEQFSEAAPISQTLNCTDCAMEGLQSNMDEPNEVDAMGELNGSDANHRKPTKSELKQARKILSGQLSKARKQVNATKKTERLSEDVKFIRRIVSLHGKERSVGSLLPIIKSLHKLMLEKKISKKSRYASTVMMIQEKLLSIYNSYPESTITIFRIPQDKLVKLVKISGGESVYKSIGLIKAFISLQGKHIDRSKAKALYQKIYNSKVSNDDPYIGKLKSILEQLSAVMKGESVKFRSQELHGLEGIARSFKGNHGTSKISKSSLANLSMNEKMARLRAMRKSNGSKKKERTPISISAKPTNGLSGIMTAAQVAGLEFERLNLTGKWATLIGNPAVNFDMMIHGEPTSGKSSLLLDFAHYLATSFGPVIYVTSEEYGAATLTDKVNLLPSNPPNLHFAHSLKSIGNLASYRFVFLDSVNDLGLTLSDYKRLREANPDTAFILILQHTKAGDFRGGKEWEHEVEIGASIENFTITVYRNRYGLKGSFNFFDPKKAAQKSAA